MDLFDIWVSIFLVLTTPASLAYPSKPRSQSLTLTNDAPPRVISQVNLTNLGQGYPVYPTTCSPPPSHGRHVPPPDLAKLLSDCYWIINKILLRQDGLLFQDPVFKYSTFKDQSGNRYLSRWHHGWCVIHVACVEKDHRQVLQLFNIVLAANKILKECIEDQQIPRGGTTPIGSPESSFYVGVLGMQKSDAANESNISLLSDPSHAGRHIRRSLARTASSFKSPVEDYDAYDLTVSLPPSISVEKRASDPQHGSSLSAGTQSSVPEGTLSTLNLVLPSTGPLGRVKAPPNYPVNCFNPYSVRLKPAAVEDCQFIINQIILRYPNPMSQRTFGYSSSADIDLSLPQNEKWIFGQCAMFVRNMDKTRTDTFRIVDVAYTAHQIMTKCVVGVKYPVGGIADVGTVADNFYVGVGGVRTTEAANNSITQSYSSADLVGGRIGPHGAL